MSEDLTVEKLNSFIRWWCTDDDGKYDGGFGKSLLVSVGFSEKDIDAALTRGNEDGN